MELTTAETALIERLRKRLTKTFLTGTETSLTPQQLDKALLRSINRELLDIIEDGVDYYLDWEWQRKQNEKGKQRSYRNRERIEAQAAALNAAFDSLLDVTE